MKNILEISASFRTKGNGDALISLCEKNFYKQQFNLKRLFLKDFNIKECSGCMGCAIKKEFCKTDDDLKSLIEQILNCDILLISSPVYFLQAPSIIKAITDRLLFMPEFPNDNEKKPAGIILTAGREGWEGFSVQNISVLLLSLGFYVKDILVSYGQGPSEVLLNENIEEKIETFSKNILDDTFKSPMLSERCPVCFGNSFQLISSKTVKCPVCNITGEIQNFEHKKPLILFSENVINNSRWSSQNLKEHMESWVGLSGQRYKEKLREIIKIRQKILSFSEGK